MKKITKVICCALSLATIFTIAGCGKKKPTTTAKPTTTQEVKKDASISFGANVEGVEYNVYSIKNNKKEIVDTTKKVALNTKLLVEVINRSTKNVEVTNSLGNKILVRSKSKDVIDVTLTNDLTISSKETDLLFVNLTADDSIAFKAYYYNSNNEKQEFSSTFTVAKDTKVYFQAVSDSTGEATGFIHMNGDIVDNAYLDYKTGHAPVTTDFDSEGITVTGNVSTSYCFGTVTALFSDIDAENVTMTIKDKTTDETISGGSYTLINLLDELEVTISNPTKKKIVFTTLYDELFVITDETFTYTTTVAGFVSFYVTDYEELEFEVDKPENDAVETYFYSYDKDGIEYEVTDGTYIVETPIYGTIKNNTKYFVNIEFKNKDGGYVGAPIHLPAGDTADIEDVFSNNPLYLGNNTVITITVTDEETEFCKVTFENETEYDYTKVLRLGYHRGMYDYPEAKFDTNIVKGRDMVIVGENEFDVTFLVYFYNMDDNDKLIKYDDISGLEHCAIAFDLDCNVKVVLRKA